MKSIKAKADSVVYKWKGKPPNSYERGGMKQMMVDMFKEKYAELAEASKEHKSKRKSTTPTDQYDKEQKVGLKLVGGHQPMERPAHVDLPASFKEPLGVISVKELGKYTWENPQRRYMISVYGNVFDVSDRPDKYGPDGPYTTLTGVDITWGLFAGVDTEDYTNRFYDLFKAKDMGMDKMSGVLSWQAWYETEYGEPVAQLDILQREEDLPQPPLDEVEACCVM